MAARNRDVADCADRALSLLRRERGGSRQFLRCGTAVRTVTSRTVPV